MLLSGGHNSRDLLGPSYAATKVGGYWEVGARVGVTNVALDPSAAQTVSVGDTVSFAVDVQPNNATHKTVKWGVGGANSGAVALYSDDNCNAPVTLDTATETTTVYAKGMSAGSATVTATNGTDDTADDKSASCDVTVNKGDPTAPTGPGAEAAGCLERRSLAIRLGRSVLSAMAPGSWQPGAFVCHAWVLSNMSSMLTTHWSIVGEACAKA